MQSPDSLLLHCPHRQLFIGRAPERTNQHLRSILLWPIGYIPIGRFQPCASFGFFRIGHLPFTEISFLDPCQKTVSTHAPSFGIIYFVLKLLQATFKAIPRTPCIRLTPNNWVKLFFAPGLLPSVRANPTRRFTFRLLTYPDWAINITLRICIGNKPPLATAPPFFLLQ